jgi:hypothetical protein
MYEGMERRNQKDQIKLFLLESKLKRLQMENDKLKERNKELIEALNKGE